MFSFAGLWEHWTSPANEEILSCTIITTAANSLLQEVHDRMPVILSREDESVWLDLKIQETEKVLVLLKQYPSEQMEYYNVSQEVNSPRNDQPSNIEPIQSIG